MAKQNVLIANIIGQLASMMISPFFNGTSIKHYRFEGYKKIKELFPDVVLAKQIAGNLRKSVETEILCEELFLIRKFVYVGVDTQIKDFTGLEYLANLEILRIIKHTDLHVFPEQIRKMGQLKTVEFSNCSIDVIPDWLYLLPKLQKLVMYNQKLTTITSSIRNAKKLEYLDLGKNSIEDLPKEIGMLKKLQFLKVDDNPLEQIPLGLIVLKDIRVINVENTRIKNVPINISLLDSLHELNIKGTEVTVINDILYKRAATNLHLHADKIMEVKSFSKEEFKPVKGMFPSGILLTSVIAIGTAGVGVSYLKNMNKKSKNKVREQEHL